MTDTDVEVVYEIEFDVPANRFRAFEDRLSSAIVEWVSHDEVTSFEVFHNKRGYSPERKFVFKFETMRQWVAFVGSDDHEVAIDRLDALAENCDAVLWERASVKLDESTNGHADGGTDR